MKRILVSGASGLLGGHVCKLALPQWQVTACYWQNRPEQEAGEWRKIDFTDYTSLKTVLAGIAPDVVVHSAANSNLDACEKEPETAYRVNTHTVENLVRLSVETGFRLIFVSTDMVFDGSGSMYRETDPVSPISVYGTTKVDAESFILKTGANAVIVRSALIYGRAVTGGTSFSIWLEDKLSRREPVALYRDQYRTPVLVSNLARVILELADNFVTGILHLGGKDRVDRYTFGKALCEIAGHDPGLLTSGSMHDHRVVAPRPVDVSLNIDRALSVLQTPVLGIEDGLHEMTGRQCRGNIDQFPRV